MHELSIAQALLDQLQSIAKREKSSITGITISIGTLSGVDAEALEQAFRIASEGTPFENSRLDINTVAARVVCHSCKKESSPDFPFLVCEHCGSFDLEITAGRDMLLQSVELESS